MPPVGFEPTTSAGELPQTYGLWDLTLRQGDSKVSVHLLITIQSSGAQRHSDHPVLANKSFGHYSKACFNYYKGR